MAELGPNDPMPCGFARVGVSIKDRLKHYRLCTHPDCKVKEQRFRPLVEAAIMTPEGQPTFGASEMLAPVGKPHPFTVILPSGNIKKFMSREDAERYIFQCAGHTTKMENASSPITDYENARGSVWGLKEDE